MNISAQLWHKRLAPYRFADNRRAALELVITLGPFLILWALIWGLLMASQFWATLGFLPAGLLVVRLFVIQHDCGHQSMFSNRRVNDWVGRALSLITLTPYDQWKRGHARHHASSGNLDRRGVGEVITMTVEEYESASRWTRLKYRLYRHPVVMFGLGPAYVFFIYNRLPLTSGRMTRPEWVSALLTNAGIALLYGALIWGVGWKVFLIIQIPTVLVGATIGVWMFYVQHQFDDTHWSRTDGWDRKDAALQGSSYYALPGWAMWVTGYIGVHHVHHLSARIPFYRLPKILHDHPELATISRLTLRESLSCVKLALWCEKRLAMVSFKAC